MKTAFITSCTHTRTLEDKARVQDLPMNLGINEALQGWMGILNKFTPSTSARELYRGMGFQTVIKIQELYKPDTIKIVTGGQGLIDIDEPIVPYDFSADIKEPHNIQQHVTREPFIQSVWWEGINRERKKGSHPVADVIGQYDLTIVSLGKVFLRYCATDILAIASVKPDKLRILLSGSSVGSVPAQLRPFIIAYDRGVIDHIPGNRNDGQHRAAQLYFQLLKEDPEFGSLSIQDQRVHFMDDTQASSRVDVEALLEERPSLLSQDPEQAYRSLRREHGNLGGRMKFKSIFRKMQGWQAPDQDQVNVAASILGSMGFTKATPAKQDDEEESIDGLRLFITALRQVVPDANFTATQVSAWATSYYEQKGESIPSYLGSPQRLVFLLKANTDVLAIKESGKGFVLA